MEPYNQATSSTGENLFELQIDQQSISYLGETARWARFLSIVGFVLCGVMVIYAFFVGRLFSTFPRSSGSADALSSVMGFGGAFFSVFFIVIALLYFFPCLYLFNFAGKMQMALRNNDQTTLNASLGNLKSCFKFVGILTIVFLSFYLLAIIVVVSVAGIMK